MTNIRIALDEMIKNDEIRSMSASFYNEGGFDDVPLGEMIFSCATIAGKI